MSKNKSAKSNLKVIKVQDLSSNINQETTEINPEQVNPEVETVSLVQPEPEVKEVEEKVFNDTLELIPLENMSFQTIEVPQEIKVETEKLPLVDTVEEIKNDFIKVNIVDLSKKKKASKKSNHNSTRLDDKAEKVLDSMIYLAGGLIVLTDFTAKSVSNLGSFLIKK